MSRGAKVARIVRRRGTTATPTARAIVSRRLGARVNPRGATASLPEEDSVPAAQGDLGLVVPVLVVQADFVLARAEVVDRGDSDRARVPVVLAWVLEEEISFLKIPKWPR